MISTSDSDARVQLHAARGPVRRTPPRSHFIPGPICRSRPPLAYYDPSIKDLTRESMFNFPQGAIRPVTRVIRILRLLPRTKSIGQREQETWQWNCQEFRIELFF